MSNLCEVCGKPAKLRTKDPKIALCDHHKLNIHQRSCPTCPHHDYVGIKQVGMPCLQCSRKVAPRPEVSLADKLLKKVKQRQWTLVELADELDVSPRRIQATLQELRDKDCYCVSLNPEHIEMESPAPYENKTVIDTEEFFGTEVSIGGVSDTHLGSKWERLDVLNTLYDIFEREGIKEVFHAGNIVEGEARFNKYDIRVHGVEEQTAYCIEHYPQRPGLVTRFVTGDDHEGWWTQREGLDFGRKLERDAREAGRQDLLYLGHVEADIALKARDVESVMRVMHPGGGTAYAISYTSQKQVESFQGGEKPAILLLGHYHKFEHSYIRNVHVVQLGTTCDQTIFMRKRKLEAHIGGCIIRFNQGAKGEINRFRVEWIPFFDKGFYERKYDITEVAA